MQNLTSHQQFTIDSLLAAHMDCSSVVNMCKTSKQSLADCKNDHKNKVDEQNVLAGVKAETFETFEQTCTHIMSGIKKLPRYIQEELDDPRHHMSDAKKTAFRRLWNAVTAYGTIAGGFLLKLIHIHRVEEEKGLDFNEDINPLFRQTRFTKDVDVYMTPDKFGKFLRWFQDNMLTVFPNPYLFLKYIYSGMQNSDQKIRFHVDLNLDPFTFDIVVTEDADTAIANFDLTFCMISCTLNPKLDDGVVETLLRGDRLFTSDELVVQAKHPKHVANRHGTMTEFFAREYLNGNSTTRNRVVKYSRYGYTIDIPLLEQTQTFVLRPPNHHMLRRNQQKSKDANVHGIRSLVVHLFHRYHLLNIGYAPYKPTNPPIALRTFVFKLLSTYDESQPKALAEYLKAELYELRNQGVDLDMTECLELLSR